MLTGGGHQRLSLQALPNCSSAFSHAPVFSEATSAWRTEDAQISGTKTRKPQIRVVVLKRLEGTQVLETWRRAYVSDACSKLSTCIYLIRKRMLPHTLPHAHVSDACSKLWTHAQSSGPGDRARPCKR